MKKLLTFLISGLLSGPFVASAQLPEPLIHLLLNEDVNATEIVNTGSDTSIFALPNNANGAILTSGIDDPERGKVWYVNSNYNGFLHIKYSKDDQILDFPGATGGKERTYSFWIKPDGLAFSALLNSGIGPSQAFDVQTEGVGNPRVGDGTNYTKMYDLTLKNQKWTHLAIVMKENAGVHEIKMYYNGRVSVPYNVGTNATVNTDPIGILKLFQKYKGWVSDFYYYDVALTHEQIGEIYGRKDLLLHYKFDEGASDISIADYSGNNVLGELSGSYSLGISDPSKSKVAKFTGGTVVTTGFKGVLGDNPRTITLWFKQDAKTFSSISYFGNNADHFQIQINDDGTVRVTNSADPALSYIITEEQYDFTTWKHLAIVSKGPDATKISLIVDGTEAKMKTDNLLKPVIFTASAGDMKAMHNTTGYVSDYRLYAGALTLAEIRNIYDTIPPSTPTSLKVTMATPLAISLEWNAASDNNVVGSYLIYRDGELIDTTMETVYADSSVISGNSYTYRVKAMDKAENESEFSNQVTASAVDTESPSAPSNLILILNTSDSITVSWSASSDNIGIAGYVVYRDGVEKATVTDLSYTDVSVIGGNTYNYSVSARDEAGNESVMSNVISVTVPTQTGIGEIQHANRQISVYPSVTSGRIFFAQPVDQVSVFSLTGREVLKTDKDQIHSIDLSYLENGIYLILTNKFQTFKVVKK